MKKEVIKHYAPIVIVAIFLIISFFIIKPYIVAIISAFILAYLMRPVQLKISKFTSKKISALICTIIILILLLSPIILLINGIVSQADNFSSIKTTSISYVERINIKLSEKFNLDLSEILNKLVSEIGNLLTNAAKQIPAIIISLAITLFGMYYILVDWEIIVASIKKYLPFENKIEISNEISQITNKIVYGTLLLALIEFIVAAIGFYISGVKYFLLLPALIALFVFIPGGPAIIWVPTLIIEILQKNYAAAIGVLIIGLIISIYLDTFLRIKLSGKGTKINPLIFLIGILGGVSIFGIFGFVIGPLILSYAIKLLEEIVE